MIPAPRWVVDVPIHPLRAAEVVALCNAAMQAGQRLTVLYANAHAVVLAGEDERFRGDLRAADVVTCDGVGLWLAARFTGQPVPERYTPPDWIDGILSQMADQGLRLFLLGSRPGVAVRAAAQLRVRYPTLSVASHHGHFALGGDEERELLRQIRAFQPDLLLVGMGMPRQERWMIRHRTDHGATVAIAVGALFDLLGGETPRGPRWMTDNGLEWASRLWFEPRRLAGRYLIGLPRFAWRVFRYRYDRRELL